MFCPPVLDYLEITPLFRGLDAVLHDSADDHEVNVHCEGLVALRGLVAALGGDDLLELVDPGALPFVGVVPLIYIPAVVVIALLVALIAGRKGNRKETFKETFWDFFLEMLNPINWF